MTNPQRMHYTMMKRLARYLVGRARMVWEYQWQGVEEVKSYSYSDWAGCKRTARSTSGGVVLRGMHHIKSWCVTQKRVTLSPAEVELGALVKTTSETIGILQMAEGLGRYVTWGSLCRFQCRPRCGKQEGLWKAPTCKSWAAVGPTACRRRRSKV